MATLLSVEELKPLLDGTPLTDAQLTTVIERVEADLTAVLGAAPNGVTAVTEQLCGGMVNLFLKRKVASVTSVTEYGLLTDSSGTILTTANYFLWARQGRLERLGGAAWGERVDVVYVPENEVSRWKTAVIDLVRIFVNETALRSESVVGSHSYTAPDNWDAEIRRVVRRLQFTVV
jgi:hypothetical protein